MILNIIRQLWQFMIFVILLQADIFCQNYKANNSNFKIYPYGSAPNWQNLHKWQKTITKEKFTLLLNKIYLSEIAKNSFFKIKDSYVEILQNNTDDKINRQYFKLHFAKNEKIAQQNYKKVRKNWRSANDFNNFNKTKLLVGYTIALDAGHIGGKFAKIEERWIQLENDKAIMEGKMTLLVAKILKKMLENHGAKVALVRKNEKPSSPISFADFVEEIRHKHFQNNDTASEDEIIKLAGKIYTRSVEIRQRAKIVNEQIKPDLAVCLHFNAEAWGDDPTHAEMMTTNSVHFLINGCYSDGELSYDDQRYEMCNRLLNQFFFTEYALSQKLSHSFHKINPMPSYTYTGTNARIIGSNPQLWARNLLANRTFDCPVVFLEPYIMNSTEDYARMQAGLYKGEKYIYGKWRQSIYIEYASATLSAILNYFYHFQNTN